MKIVKIVGGGRIFPAPLGALSGAKTKTPHDGRYLVAWNPHVEFGMLACDSTDDIEKAKLFPDTGAILAEYDTVSRVQPVRPDGKPNKPLTGLTIEIADPWLELKS